jgi:hypothetical protein
MSWHAKLLTNRAVLAHKTILSEVAAYFDLEMTRNLDVKGVHCPGPSAID